MGFEIKLPRAQTIQNIYDGDDETESEDEETEEEVMTPAEEEEFDESEPE